jgi:DNA-binding transcriptional LysR family regulator
LSQPAVSQQIKELENFFGHSLFDRSGRSLMLTAAGEVLRAHVAKILEQMKAAHEELDEIRGEPSGTLVVGAGHRALENLPIEGVAINRKLWLLTPPSESHPERLKRFSEFITGHLPKLPALLTAMALAIGGTPPVPQADVEGNPALA